MVTVLVDPHQHSTSAMSGSLVNAMNQNRYNAVIQNDGPIDVTGHGVMGSTPAAAGGSGANTGIDSGTQSTR